MLRYKGIFRRQGAWRSDLLWRLFGLSLFEHAVLHVAHVKDWALFSTYGLQWLFPAALVFMLGGARPSSVLAGWVLILAHYVRRLAAGAEVQVGEEFGIFLSLPILGLVGYVVAAQLTARPRHSPLALNDDAHERHVDDVQVALFRVAAVSTLLWATLHKINTDFLYDAVSCGPMLAKEITQWWSLPLPEFILYPTPWRVVLGEGLCGVLLLLWPRVGLVWTTLVVGVIGQRGATGFAMLAVVLALSVLEHDDGRRIARSARSLWPWVVALTICLLTISAKTYIGARLWYEFMFLQVFLLLTLYAAVSLVCQGAYDAFADKTVVADLLSNLRWRTLRARISPGPISVHVLIAVAWLAAILNGLSPYLGWKYRLSFAMLSNLRVDDTRWNSLLFPESIRMSAHDPFVHITRLRMDAHAREILDGLASGETRALMTGLTSPMSLEYRMRYVKFHQLHIDVELTYKGEALVFTDVANNVDFEKWVEGLPKTLMWQSHLVEEGPQPCTH